MLLSLRTKDNRPILRQNWWPNIYNITSVAEGQIVKTFGFGRILLPLVDHCYSNSQKYRPIGVLVLVLDLNQNSGFGRTLDHRQLNLTPSTTGYLYEHNNGLGNVLLVISGLFFFSIRKWNCLLQQFMAKLDMSQD